MAGITGFCWGSEGNGRLGRSRGGFRDKKYILKKQDGKAWTGLISPRFWKSGRLLLTG
jgi:hypothetical protein